MTASAAAAADTFLEIPGAPGESQDQQYPNSIELTEWNWDLHRDATSGKAVFGGFDLKKNVDRASPFLFTHAGNGARIPDMRVIVRRAGTKPVSYLEYCLEQTAVTSYSVSGGGGDELPTEEIKLDPGALEMRYVRQTATGKTFPPLFAGWSVVTNDSIGFNADCGGTKQ
jgi:type VI secretion system secreted protein Hcp